MRGTRVKALREALRQANIMIGIATRPPDEGITLKRPSFKRIKRNHRGNRKAFSKPANVTTGFHCCRPAAVARKIMIAAKYEKSGGIRVD